MHKRSVRFSILLVILTLCLGFGVSFVAPKPVRADALGDFITKLSLGDFIRGLFNGLFGGTAGDDPYVCEFTNLGDCTPNCTGGSCTSNGCSGGTYKCVPAPTPTICTPGAPAKGMAGFVQQLLGQGDGSGNTCGLTPTPTTPILCSSNNCLSPNFCVNTYTCVSPTPIQQCNGQNCSPPNTCGFGGGLTLHCLTPTPIPTVAQCKSWDLRNCQDACPSGKCEQCQDNLLTHRCLPGPTVTPIFGITPGPNGCNLSCPVCSSGKICDNQGCRSNLVKCNNPIPTLTATPTLTQCQFGGLSGWAACQLACGAGNCTDDGCASGYRCTTAPFPTRTPTPTLRISPTSTFVPTRTPTPIPTVPAGANACRATCSNGVLSYCVACTGNVTAGYTCATWQSRDCVSGLCQNTTSCNDATPTPTSTPRPRPTATSVPNLSPTVTVGAGTPPPSPYPTNTSVPYPTEPPGPPVATATPTTPVGAPCYYNVKLVNQDNGSVLPSALQQGITETGGCRTQGVRELVPSFFTQPSQATNRPEWPCTDATYVGQSCTQGIVTGQFICMGGPQHEIKGCYNRTSDAYQRVSITVLSPTPTVTPPAGATATVTPTQPPVATPTPAYSSFEAWFTIFRSYVDGPSGGIPTTLTHLEDWRNNIPVPTPTPL